MRYAILGAVLLLMLAVGCAESTPTATPQPAPTATSLPPTATPTMEPEPEPEPTQEPTATSVPPTATPTMEPEPTEATAAFTLTDATGEVLTFETRPERAACLTEICADIMAEIGLEPVAVNDPLSSDPRFFGSKAEEFQLIGGSFFEPNLEDIAASKPDLVFGLGGVHDGLRDALRPIAPLYIVNPASYEDSIGYLRDVGALMDRADEAEEAVERFLAKLEDYKSRSPKDRSALGDVRF